LEDRIARIGRDDRKTPDDARKFCLEEEQARTRYLKTYFNADINDPLHYHLVINTSLMGYENAAKLIADAVLKL
jgi:cytidylate kinase